MSWVTKFNMMFGEDTDFMSHINGTSTIPSCKVSTVQNNIVQCNLHHALQGNITAANSERSLAESQNQVLERLSRNSLQTQKNDIVNVAESLSNLGHPPAAIDIVDSILMNLDPSFAIVHTLLTTQTSEPTLTAVKKTLTDQEDTKSALDGGSGDKEEVMYVKRRGRKTKRTGK
ncbi:hypothetical protein K439DRAFT_1612995 [Ramaria rubella]|nr:hypothetical protein K439DRAFT_1612995 [Ramaria rubella]